MIDVPADLRAMWVQFKVLLILTCRLVVLHFFLTHYFVLKDAKMTVTTESSRGSAVQHVLATMKTWMFLLSWYVTKWCCGFYGYFKWYIISISEALNLHYLSYCFKLKTLFQFDSVKIWASCQESCYVKWNAF